MSIQVDKYWKVFTKDGHLLGRISVKKTPKILLPPGSRAAPICYFSTSNTRITLAALKEIVEKMENIESEKD